MRAVRKKYIYTAIAVILFVIIIIGCIFLREKILKYRYPVHYREYVELYSDEYDVPEEIIFAIILVESGFDKNAKSHADAHGLMQILPSTYEWLSELMGESFNADDITEPESNIKHGVFYLSFLYDMFGNWDTTIASYNAGQGKVSNWLSDTRFSDDGETLKDIPGDETRNYVKKVKKAAKIYVMLYYEKNNDSKERQGQYEYR